jgi:hypothetical protein
MVQSHALEGYPRSMMRSSRTSGDPQATLHDGWACKKPFSSCSAPRTPRPTAPSGTGVHDGANLTRKPASRRSSARACKGVAGVEPGGATRAALVSRTAPESAAVIVRERRIVSRAEPRSRSERARISPRISRLAHAGSSVSTTVQRAVSGRAGSVGDRGTCSRLSQQRVAENSISPAVLVAMVPAGSPVASTAVVSRLSAPRRPRDLPGPLSGPPFVPA